MIGWLYRSTNISIFFLPLLTSHKLLFAQSFIFFIWVSLCVCNNSTIQDYKIEKERKNEK